MCLFNIIPTSGHERAHRPRASVQDHLQLPGICSIEHYSDARCCQHHLGRLHCRASRVLGWVLCPRRPRPKLVARVLFPGRFHQALFQDRLSRHADSFGLFHIPGVFSVHGHFGRSPPHIRIRAPPNCERAELRGCPTCRFRKGHCPSAADDSSVHEAARRRRCQPCLHDLRRPPHPALHPRAVRPQLRPRVFAVVVPHRTPLSRGRAARVHARPTRRALRPAPQEVLSAVPRRGRRLPRARARTAWARDDAAARGRESVEGAVRWGARLTYSLDDIGICVHVFFSGI